jgi:protein-disulfide isomerase
MSSSTLSTILDALTSKKGAILAVPAILLFGATIAVGQQPGTPPAAATVAETSGTAGTTSSPPAAMTPGAALFSPEQKAAIEQIVKEYFLANPEVMADIQQSLEAKMERIQSDRMKTALITHAAELFRTPDVPEAGNPKGDVTIVEFSDYNCGYCRRALHDVAKFVEGDKQVRILFREFPILTPASEVVARLALAARLQGKYWEFHRAVMGAPGQASEASALKEAAKLGLDIDKLKADANSEEIKKHITDNKALAQKMGINGTPFFMIGDRVVPGAPENLAEVLAENVMQIRKSGGCKIC